MASTLYILKVICYSISCWNVTIYSIFFCNTGRYILRSGLVINYYLKKTLDVCSELSQNRKSQIQSLMLVFDEKTCCQVCSHFFLFFKSLNKTAILPELEGQWTLMQFLRIHSNIHWAVNAYYRIWIDSKIKFCNSWVIKCSPCPDFF